MRFEQIDLTAFGPFTDTSLELGNKGPGLHLIYGPNEAGKSSLLRALGDFLFGVPANTQDGHVHLLKNLRIGAKLAFASGETLDLVRRKGLKNTLQDGAGEQAEAQLKRQLGPVDRAQFDGLFGLDHQSLRDGARALFANQGDVAQSLFDAGGGAKGKQTSIKSIIDALEDEARELYKDGGKKSTINKAISEHKRAKQELGRQSLSNEAWEAKLKEVARAEAERDRLIAETAQLNERQRTLERQQRVAPKLAARQRALEALQALGSTPEIAPDAAAQRQQDQKDLLYQQQAIGNLESKQADLSSQLEALSIPGDLLQVADEQAAELRSAGAALRAAARKQPSQRKELANLQRDMQLELKPLAGIEAPWPNPSQAQAEHIVSLIQVRGALETDLRHSEDALREAKEQAAEAQRKLGGAAPTLKREHEAALTSALLRAQQLGDAEEQRDALRSQASHAQEDIERSLASLPLWDGTPEECSSLALPSDASVLRARQSAETLERARAKSLDSLEKLRATLAQLEAELDQEGSSQKLPSLELLGERRTERDTHWQAIRAGAKPAGPAGDQLEESTQAADQVADRLRLEAARITKIEHLGGSISTCKKELAEELTRSKELASQQALQEQAWQAHWTALHVQALSPGEMQDWIASLRNIQLNVAGRLKTLRNAEGLGSRISQCGAALSEALGAAEVTCDPSSSLALLIELAGKVLADNTQRRTSELNQRAASEAAQALTQKCQAKKELAERDHAAWQANFAEALGVIHMQLPAKSEAVLAQLNALQRLNENQVQMDAIASELEAQERAELDLEQQLAALEFQVDAKGEELAVHERLEQFMVARDRARFDLERQSSLRASLEECTEELGKARAIHQAARTSLDQAMQRAGVEEESDLPPIEERVAKQQAAELELEQCLEAVRSAGAPLELEALIAENAGLDMHALEDELLELKRSLFELSAARDAASEQAGTAAGALKAMRSNSAADLEFQKASQLERIRAASERYLRLRMAARILREEVEVYRKENQGPLLRRASELFPRLTQGRYSEVRAESGDDDQPTLACLRTNDDAVPIEALSDGTRDQLYLALRIASIERHLEHAEPMPLVLDDILVHFDDERAKVALEVLAELAQKTQVLFFTHHTRLRELAREVVGAELREHQLN